VPSVDLVGLYTEALTHDATLPLGWEEAVLACQYEPRRHVWPSLERVRLTHRRSSLRAGMGGGLRTDIGGHVVQEDFDGVEVRPDLHGMAGRSPPVGLPRAGAPSR
jgi:hypothetical protein